MGGKTQEDQNVSKNVLHEKAFNRFLRVLNNNLTDENLNSTTVRNAVSISNKYKPNGFKHKDVAVLHNVRSKGKKFQDWQVLRNVFKNPGSISLPHSQQMGSLFLGLWPHGPRWLSQINMSHLHTLKAPGKGGAW